MNDNPVHDALLSADFNLPTNNHPRVGARAGASSTPRSSPSRRPDVQDATEANSAHSPMRKRSEIST